MCKRKFRDSTDHIVKFEIFSVHRNYWMEDLKMKEEVGVWFNSSLDIWLLDMPERITDCETLLGDIPEDIVEKPELLQKLKDTVANAHLSEGN